MPKQPRVYGTPVGVAGGPSEKPTRAEDRKSAKPASDSQVHQALKETQASDAAWRRGREAPARTASPKAAGTMPGARDAPSGPIDALKNRGKRIDRAVESAEKG